VFNAKTVEIGDIRMEVWHIGGRSRKPGDNLGLLPLNVVHTSFHTRLIHAVLKGGDDPGNGLVNFHKRLLICRSLRTLVTVEIVHLLCIGFESLHDCIRRGQPLFQAIENTRLNLVAGDGAAIVAGAGPVAVETGITVRRDDADLAAAASADKKAGQKMNRPVRQMHSLHAAFQCVGGIGVEGL